MTIVGLVDRCIPIGAAQQFSILLPGGAELPASAGLEKGNNAAVVRPFLSSMAAATAFLGPFYTALETGTAALEVLKAVPKVVTQPQKIIEALEKLAKVTPKLLALAPQFSLPPLLKGILTMVATSINALADELGVLVAADAETNDAAALAEELELSELADSVACARAEIAAAKSNLAASFGPINKLLAFVRGLAGLLPVPVEIPSVEDPGENAEEAIATMHAVAATLLAIANVIPG